MKYYDADDNAICLILDEMSELLTSDQLLIFDALRAGVPRPEIAYDLGISRNALNLRIQRIYKRIRNRHCMDPIR